MQRLVRQQFFSGDSGMGIVGSSQGWIRRLLSGSAILACALLPAAAAGEHLDRLLEEEREMLSLYFGEEQLVEVATRHPKPLSQVAENVTVITAAEIEAMHAHSVAEVLERVPGVFVQFLGRDFASPSAIFIHGSEYEHVLVLVDGIRWNYVGQDFPETNLIPVEIIDRIEVIKGAASSAWGSALGGVVNIITKQTGRTTRPAGSAALAVGEHGVRHYHGQAAGRVDDFGYYLFAGRRQSDGIRDSRFFRDNNLFGKFSYSLSGGSRLEAQIGYSEPEFKYLHLEDFDYASKQDNRVRFYSGSLDSSLTPDLYFYLQVYGHGSRQVDTGWEISTGTAWDSLSYKGEQRGVNSRFAWEKGPHTLVLGVEYLHRETVVRDLMSGAVSPSLSEEILSLYVNDTIRLGKVTVTPGIRYDRLAIGDDQVSPSLGATYRLSQETTLRATVSRGYRKPNLYLKEQAQTDPPYITPNPDLESETIRTYQAGIEVTAIPRLWLQTMLFRHEADRVWFPDDATGAWLNGGETTRTGIQAAFRTAPFHDFSLAGNYALVRTRSDWRETDNLYKVNLILEYLNQVRGLQAQLFGNYVRWDDAHEAQGEFYTMIWDLSLRQRLRRLSRDREAELFFKVHNLFNGTHSWHVVFPNSPRWAEAGLRLRF
jgi:vitamin B12 transporter